MQLAFKNKRLSLDSPAVMGILNVTPDSFFDGGKYTGKAALLRRAEKMISEGAGIIDIGGCSTRPGAVRVSERDEIKRMIPAIELVRKKFPGIIISADTFRSAVAGAAVAAGADMINDVSGGEGSGEGKSRMFETVAKFRVPYVLTHILGTPQTMQDRPHYKNVVKEVMEFFEEKIIILESLKVKNLIIDPGFGFGKTVEHNYALLKNLSEFRNLGFPVLAGVSRKSMINRVIGTTPQTALNGTTVANTMALMNGADILRVHDVKEARQAISIFLRLRSA